MNNDANSVDRPLDSIAAIARGALERVCSGASLGSASRYYGPTFCDHVNDSEFRGLDGVRQSVERYAKVLNHITVTVLEQLQEGNRVTSRFVVSGVNRGRKVCFNGITISRFENGLIVEDWSVTDTLGMLRQLGLWRTLLLGIRQRQSTREHVA